MPIPGHLTGEPRCRAALDALGLAWPILRPGVPMPTVSAAAVSIGVAPELIAKTLDFVDPAGAIVVAIASELDRTDRRRLAEIAGAPRLRLADPAPSSRPPAILSAAWRQSATASPSER